MLTYFFRDVIENNTKLQLEKMINDVKGNHDLANKLLEESQNLPILDRIKEAIENDDRRKNNGQTQNALTQQS